MMGETDKTIRKNGEGEGHRKGRKKESFESK